MSKMDMMEKHRWAVELILSLSDLNVTVSQTSLLTLQPQMFPVE